MKKMFHMPFGLGMLALVAFLSFGCAGPKAFVAGDFVAPDTVAFLPMRNEAIDVDAPKIMREKLQQSFGTKGYSFSATESVDTKLREELGIQEGGQLASSNPKEIGEKLGVDGLFYGTVTAFKFFNVGFIQTRKVSVRMELIEAKSGKKLWEVERKSSHWKFATSMKEARDMGLTGLGEKLLGKIVKHHPLGKQINRVANKLTRSLPR